MEEKKLTDEAVSQTVKSLKWLCNQIPNDLGDSNEERILKCIQLYCEQGIAVINLLQSENAEQKTEIERLKEKFSISHYRDSWKNKFFKAQEEIERLTEELKLLVKQCLKP